MSNRHGKSCFIIFIVLIFVSSILDYISSLTYYLNFEGKNIFIPYYSDRNVVPFPLLFKEFDLSNRDAITSKVPRSRGSDEWCTRRLLPEYENYRLNRENIFQNVPKKGFLASRHSPPGWLSYTPVDKLVLNLLDAYRFDYVIEDPELKEDSNDVRNIFTNNMSTFYDMMKSKRSDYHHRLYKLLTSYPTLTVFAVKGILSGDTRNVGMVAGNRNPSDMKLDHLPNQFHTNKFRLNLIGDVTSLDMAPNSFDVHITNKHKNTVNDIYNADQMVYDNYKEYVDKSDVMIIHLVGADHLSHCGGRNTPDMTSIMKNYNIFVKDLMNEYSKHRNHMIFFFGDHGQKESGSHGDDSIEEVETFLLITSDLMMRADKLNYCPISETPTAYRLNHSALGGKVELPFTYGHQYTRDICPTAALLTNVPIPFHSEGCIIPTAVPFIMDAYGNVHTKLSNKYLVQLYHVNVHQLLRVIDVLIGNQEVKLNQDKLDKIMTQRLKLANMYYLLRLVDTSNPSKFDQVEKLYSNYILVCRKLIDMSATLVQESTKSFTFHYLYVSIIIKYVTIVILLYCLVATLKYYKMGKHVADADSDKKVDKTIVEKVLLRVLRSIFSSLFLSLLLGSRFKKNVNLRFVTLNLTWPLGPFKHASNLSQKLTHFFSNFFVVDEYSIYLHFSVLYAVFLTLFLLYDLPLLYTSYRFLLTDYSAKMKPQSKELSFPSALKTFAYNVGRFSLRKLTTALFCVVVILVVVSECALYSHDTISRHMLVIFMLIETVPFLLRDSESYLFNRIRMRLVFLFALSKLSSFFHDYRLFFYSSDLPTDSWLAREKVLSYFEVGAVSLTIFYVLLMKFMLRFNKDSLRDSKDHFQFSISSCASVFKMKKLMLIVYSVSFACVMANYALMTQSSLLGLNNFISNLHNAYNMKMFVSSVLAWVVLVLFFLTFVLLIVNPFNLFFYKDQSYRVSSFLLYTIPNFCFLIFLVLGHKKALHLLLGILILYQSCFILICKNSNFYLSHALLLKSVADSIYFANGGIDNIVNMNFQVGFVFVTTYHFPISDITTFFSVFCVHILFSMVLMFTYFNSASLKYDLLDASQSIESGLGSFELHTTDKFEAYLIKTINEEYIEVKHAEVSRKCFTLTKIIHVIALFIALVSVLGFIILIAIMKMHNVPCIALRSFPKALFILGKSTSMFATQLLLFLLRSAL